MNAPKVAYEVIYNQKDITKDILGNVIRFSYTDKSQGEADEIEIVLEDAARLWQNEWYPTKGDTISARIFDANGTLNCGSFTVDEVIGEGSKDGGDMIAIKGIAAGIKKKIRTKTSYAHENKTLREIANTVAGLHGFSVEGSIKDVRIARVTQYRESDLKFLKRLSYEYGYTFSVRDNKLIFTNIFELENKSSALTLHRSELVNWSITDKTSNTYRAAKISYHNPKEKKIVSFEQQEKEEAYQGAKADTLELRIKAENEQQAELKSRVALYRANSLQQEGAIDIPGNILAIAGNNCELQGLGMFSGKYYLETSTHSVDKDGGYTTNCNVKRVGLVNKSKQKNTTKKS